MSKLRKGKGKTLESWLNFNAHELQARWRGARWMWWPESRGGHDVLLCVVMKPRLFRLCDPHKAAAAFLPQPPPCDCCTGS